MQGILAATRRHSTGAAVLAGYSWISFLYVGLAPIVRAGPQYIGHGYDPQIFIWAFSWWPHAIAHGQNPFLTHAVWAPDGVNLTWATTVPGLALLFAPVTVLAGPILAYDIAAVLMPALAAWGAFLLCRYLTRALWPSLVGGYLFGFSSYVLAAGPYGGHLHLSAVLLLPAITLTILRFLDGNLQSRGLVVRLAPLLALQLLLSTEIMFTLTLAVVAACAVGLLLVPSRRPALRGLVKPLAGSYSLAGVLTAPFLYYMVSGGVPGRFYAPGGFTTDLANFVVPTKITALGGSLFPGIAGSFAGNPSEQGAYVGLPLLLILCLFARARFRTPSGRFLLVSLVLAVLAALGARAMFEGRGTVWLPWSLVQSLPAFDNVLTNRLNVYMWLVLAVVAALWTASAQARWLRFALPLLAVAAIVPVPDSSYAATTYHVPAFFSDKRYRTCIDSGDTIVPFPFRGGNALLWQVEDGFRFNMVGGDLGPDFPKFFNATEFLPIMDDLPLAADQARIVRDLIAGSPVLSIVADARDAQNVGAALDQIASPHVVGGVYLYNLTSFAPPCAGP